MYLVYFKFIRYAHETLISYVRIRIKIMSTLIKYSEAFYESGEGFAHKTLIKRLFVNLTNCKRHMNAVLNLNLLTLPAGSYSKPSLEGDG